MNLNGSRNVKDGISDLNDSETTLDGTKLLLSQFIKYYGSDDKSQDLLLESIKNFKMVRKTNQASTTFTIPHMCN